MLSIVFAVLNSHEVLRRQMLHFEKIMFPSSYEIVIVDDGSDPPLTYDGPLNVVIHPTNDFRPWTHTKAFNIGAEIAKGEWMIQCAIDHILSRELINRCMRLEYPIWKFRREVGILDENGDFTQDKEELVRYGFPRERLERRGARISAHGGIFFIKRDLYLKIGGRRSLPVYPHRDEVPLKQAFRKLWANGLPQFPVEERPVLYMIPNGRFCGDKNANPFGLFHGLQR